MSMAESSAFSINSETVTQSFASIRQLIGQFAQKLTKKQVQICTQAEQIVENFLLSILESIEQIQLTLSQESKSINSKLSKSQKTNAHSEQQSRAQPNQDTLRNCQFLNLKGMQGSKVQPDYQIIEDYTERYNKIMEENTLFEIPSLGSGKLNTSSQLFQDEKAQIQSGNTCDLSRKMNRFQNNSEKQISRMEMLQNRVPNHVNIPCDLDSKRANDYFSKQGYHRKIRQVSVERSTVCFKRKIFE